MRSIARSISRQAVLSGSSPRDQSSLSTALRSRQLIPPRFGFATIKDYFQRAIIEINSIDGLRSRFVDRNATSFGATIVNGGHRNGTAHISVHCRNSHIALGDIYYSFSENAGENTANGGFNISTDDYEQFLTQTMNVFGKVEERLTPERAAEVLWNEFIGNAGVAYD